MYAELLVLRLVHVLGAIFWVGSGLFTTFYLRPVLAGMGPAAGPVMGGLQQRRLFTVLPVVATLTILSGIRLMMITSGGFAASYFASPMGRTFAWGGVAGIAAFVLSLVVARPAMLRGAKLGRALAEAPEAERAALAARMARVQRVGGVANVLAVALLVLAAAAMAVARYAG